MLPNLLTGGYLMVPVLYVFEKLIDDTGRTLI